MGEAVLYTEQTPLRIPVTNVMRAIEMLDEEGLTEEFLKAAGDASLTLEPAIEFLNRRGLDIQNLPTEVVPVPDAVGAIRTMRQRGFSAEFVQGAATPRVTVSPALVNTLKEFLATRGVDERNQLAARITARCEPPVPYECPQYEP
jgi:hypothetical protein